MSRARYHPFGMYYFKRHPVRIIDSDRRRGRRYVTIQYRDGATEEVEAHLVHKQPHPPRIFPPFTRRGSQDDKVRSSSSPDRAVGMQDTAAWWSAVRRWLSRRREPNE